MCVTLDAKILHAVVVYSYRHCIIWHTPVYANVITTSLECGIVDPKSDIVSRCTPAEASGLAAAKSKFVGLQLLICLHCWQ